jgi:uracil-DNA glycosylase
VISVRTWKTAIPLLRQNYHLQLLQQVAQLRSTRTIYPAQDQILRALETTSFPAVRVVILGQDPYHGEGQAHGLAFSVPVEVTPPPSLRNIFLEIQQDLYGENSHSFSPDLTSWAGQGVLLLNSVLTVEAGCAGSHRNLGWEKLTDQLIEQLSRQRENLVFLLWGASARAKVSLIDPQRHLVLEAPHPSPLSAYRGFWGCRHFSQTNKHLEQCGSPPIEW